MEPSMHPQTLSPWNNLIVRQSKFTLWLRIAAVMLIQNRWAQFLPGKARLRCKDWCKEVLSVGACSEPSNSIYSTTKAILNLSSSWSWKRSTHFWKNAWLSTLYASMTLIRSSILSRCTMRLLTSLRSNFLSCETKRWLSLCMSRRLNGGRKIWLCLTRVSIPRFWLKSLRRTMLIISA